MTIVVGCRCGQRFAVRNALAGSQQRCPSCGAPLDIGASSHSSFVDEDWLFDELTDGELTSIAELTRSGAALTSRPAPGLNVRRRLAAIIAGLAAAVAALRRPRLAWAAGAILVLLVAPVVVLAVWHFRANSQVDAEMAWIVESGSPVTPDDLSRSYALPPDAPDATRLWLDGALPLGGKGFNGLSGGLSIIAIDERKRPIPPPGTHWEDIARVDQLLRQYHGELSTLHAAADAGGSARYPLEFEGDGQEGDARHELLVRGAKLLALEAHLRAHQKAPEGVTDSIGAVFSLAKTLEREPTLDAHSRCLTCAELGRQRIRLLLTAVDFTPAQLAVLREELQQADFEAGLHAALVGERVRGIDALQHPRRANGSGGAASPQIPAVASSEDCALYLVLMNRAVAAAETPLEVALAEAAAIDRDLAQHVQGGLLGKRRYANSARLTPPMGELFRAAARATALHSAADAAVAIELYRRETGRLPEQMEELVPKYLDALPRDPFTGRAQFYAQRPGGFVIYSAGPDGANNGGTDEQDVPFFVPQF